MSKFVPLTTLSVSSGKYSGCYSYPALWIPEKLEAVLHVKFDFVKTTSNWLYDFGRAEMSKHSRGDQKTKKGHVCRKRFENVSSWFWMQLSNNSNYLFKVNIAVHKPLNITTRPTYQVTSSITKGVTAPSDLEGRKKTLLSFKMPWSYTSPPPPPPKKLSVDLLWSFSTELFREKEFRKYEHIDMNSIFTVAIR